jgi:alpha-galactosidase
MDACANGLPLRRVALRAADVRHAVRRTSSRFWRVAFLFAGMLGCGFMISRGVDCVAAGKTSSARETGTAVAVRLTGRLDAEGFPAPVAWEKAPAMRFDHDWQGKNADPQRETEVQLLWTPDALYLKFVVHYRSITVFGDAEPDGRRDKLWERDVAEVFLQPPESGARQYKEIEVSPNGLWIDLDIAPGEKHDPQQGGLRRQVRINEQNKTWVAELALPMKSLTEQFDPAKAWRVNFFRVEGASEPRFYSAWRPTGTAVPNFHVPECFDKLVFEL